MTHALNSDRKRLIPDKDTFQKYFGEDFHLIKKIPGEVLAMVPDGDPFPSVKKTLSPSSSPFRFR